MSEGDALAVRPHFPHVSRWPDTMHQWDTPSGREGLPTSGPLYSAYVQRAAPREMLRGVEIVDYEHGVLYEVVAERRHGRPVLVRKTVAAYGADTLTDAAQLPDDYLAIVALDYWENEQPPGPLAQLDQQVEPRKRTRSRRPSLERIAQIVRDSQHAHELARKNQSVSRDELAKLVPRRMLALRFGVHLQTADIWLRQAREAGLLPPARDGHPGKTTAAKK